MIDVEKLEGLTHVLAAAGRAHHEAIGAPNPGWPEWYGTQVLPQIGEYVGFEPTLDQVAEWLREADEHHRAEAPDDRWPGFYARWILEHKTV